MKPLSNKQRQAVGDATKDLILNATKSNSPLTKLLGACLEMSEQQNVEMSTIHDDLRRTIIQLKREVARTDRLLNPKN